MGALRASSPGQPPPSPSTSASRRQISWKLAALRTPGGEDSNTAEPVERRPPNASGFAASAGA
eukprot:15473992-Alexandrium_andersonii.AAC.1